MDDFTLEKLRRSDLDTLVHWAEGEGWNPGPHDAEVFWKADPEGYRGFFRGRELVAGGSIVSYGGRFGFMGFFIVKEAYRHLGIGRRLWHQRRDALRERLRDGASIGMDGVVAMLPFYERGGFTPAFRSVRMETPGRRFPRDPRVAIVGDGDMDEVLEFDRECFGFPRDTFMRAWLNLPESRVYRFRNSGDLGGFAVLRRAARGFKIGPLFARETGAAQALLQACLSAAGDEALFLDIPMINGAAVELADRFGMKPVFECARMYYGEAPDIPLGNVFGITTFELG